jgi:hyperosmotically inducible protein
MPRGQPYLDVRLTQWFDPALTLPVQQRAAHPGAAGKHRKRPAGKHLFVLHLDADTADVHADEPCLTSPFTINHVRRSSMKYRLATTCFVIGATLAPLAAYAEDTDKDRANPATFVKDSAITTKIKSKLAAENLASLKDIKVDTDQNGVVWMSGTVKSQSEADQALTIARNTEGVKSVKSNLKVQKG